MIGSLADGLVYLIAVLTALAGLAALLPRTIVVRVVPSAALGPAGWFLLRHWAVLVVMCGALLFWAAGHAAVRAPVLAMVAIEKFCYAGLVFVRRDPTTIRSLRPGAVADLVAALILIILVAVPHL